MRVLIVTCEFGWAHASLDGHMRVWMGKYGFGWFDVIKNTMIHDDGRVVPIVVGIGNHEMKRYVGGNQWYSFEGSISPFEPTYEWRSANAPYFFQLFAFPGHKSRRR